MCLVPENKEYKNETPIFLFSIRNTAFAISYLEKRQWIFLGHFFIIEKNGLCKFRAYLKYNWVCSQLQQLQLIITPSFADKTKDRWWAILCNSGLFIINKQWVPLLESKDHHENCEGEDDDHLILRWLGRLWKRGKECNRGRWGDIKANAA